MRDDHSVGLWKALRKKWHLLSSKISFLMANSKEVWVADVWNSATEGGGWVLCFSRPFNDWEMESAECLLVQLQEKGAYRSTGKYSLANRCFLCHVEEESIDHILVHYVKTKIPRQLLFTLFGVSWVLSTSVTKTLFGWYGSFSSKKSKKARKVTPLCLFWTI
ncbi:hypothetical protein CK203_109283 [Vitis vinifera]|uniref:Reverse transcriptase zinc-binding domain-containing protein n=1 Tax=Vitis vinifera TaxID=29760 RepID=A0A438DAC1_VITVI|nr:hypothetical protein CK203_109283 [Vitis vinifera]